MKPSLPDAALDQLFRDARTYNQFSAREVDDATLRALYELYRWGPTAMNSQPGRVVFVRSAQAKARLKPALAPGNVDKTLAAPVTAIVAYDPAFHEHLATQYPANPAAAAMFGGNAALALDTATRNGTLQGAYLIIAARALGLDSGPMSGFNATLLNEAFFPDGRWRANFLVNLGWGDPAGVRPRGPRLDFGDVVRIE